MALVKTKWVCVCGGEKEVKMQKPNYFTPTVVRIECPQCGSDFTVQYVKPKNAERNQIHFHNRIDWMSPRLKKVYVEQQEKEKLKAQESPPATP